MAFVRRFTADPGLAILIEIESVSILDVEPSAPLTSTGTGTVMLVGEFEKGPYNTPTEVFGPSDLMNTFGGLGFTYDGVVCSNPCARGRKADGAVNFEYWNGNGAIALNGKKFARLVLVRVDTSVGSVSFTRCASILGTALGPTYDLTTGQVVIFDIGAGNVTATFTGVAATYVGGAFPGAGGTSHFAGGEWVDLSFDKGTSFRVYFSIGDQTCAQVCSRINAAAGYTFATVAGGGVTLTGQIAGLAGEAKIIAADAAGTLTALGWAVHTQSGTGNVGNIVAVTVAYAHAVIHAASASVSVDVSPEGWLRIYNSATPGTGTIKVDAGTSATGFGFETGRTDSAAVGIAGTIPAGTRVRTAGAVEWVTCDDVEVTAASAGPYTVKVRPANDESTTVGTGGSTVVVIPYAFSEDAYAVNNTALLTAALTESQLDVAYGLAFDSSIDINSVAKEVNTVYCARQSNAVRRKGRQNALDASAGGCYGRRFIMRPPKGTTRVLAKGAVEPGRAAYASERVVYTFPYCSVYVPGIAARGVAGGDGFTADGFIECGADGFMAVNCSLLPSEENPAQVTDNIDAISGLESGTEYVGWTIDDYKSFKANGICALLMTSGKPEFYSGITAVDPLVHPAEIRISRRRIADEIEDTCAVREKSEVKKLGTRARWSSQLATINAYLNDMKRSGRIEDLIIDGKKGNTPATWALGVRWVIAKVKTIASQDYIVIQAEIGENVDVTAV